MQRLLITRDLVTRSGRRFITGRQVELTDGEAQILIRRGVARAVRPPAKSTTRTRKRNGKARAQHRS